MPPPPPVLSLPRWAEPVPPRPSQRALPGRAPVCVLDVSGTMADHADAARECMKELLQPGLGALSMGKVGSGRNCSPRHRMLFNSRHKGSECVG